VGKFQGSLSDMSATQLGAIVVREAVKRAKLDPNANARAHLLAASLVLSCIGLLAGYGLAGFFSSSK